MIREKERVRKNKKKTAPPALCFEAVLVGSVQLCLHDFHSSPAFSFSFSLLLLLLFFCFCSSCYPANVIAIPLLLRRNSCSLDMKKCYYL